MSGENINYGVDEMTEEEYKIIDKQILDSLVKDRGIEVIREYLKEYDKKIEQVEKQTRDNNNLDVALIFFKLRNDGMRTKDAEEETARIINNKPIDELEPKEIKNVNRHITKFNKKAKDINYMNFGAMIDECYNEISKNSYIDFNTKLEIIKEGTTKYYIPYKLAEASYYKYLVDKEDMRILKTFKRDYSQYLKIDIHNYKYLINDEVPF